MVERAPIRQKGYKDREKELLKRIVRSKGRVAIYLIDAENRHHMTYLQQKSIRLRLLSFSGA